LRGPEGGIGAALRSARDEGRAVGVSLEGLWTVPGWTVRVAAGAAAAGLFAVAGLLDVGRPAGTVLQLLAAALVAGVVARPRDGWGGAALLVVGMGVLAAGDPGAGRLAALLLVGHLAVLLAALAARVRWGCRVEVAVPAGLARRAWPVQLGAQALALVVRPVAQAAGGAGAGLWRVAALAVAVGLLATVLPPRRLPPT
jgi:hypothetical protein